MLNEEIETSDRYRNVGIRVETYVVSSGLEELLKATRLAPSAHAIWGSSFDYDPAGRPTFPKKVVSFTDKTRYLFVVQKGKLAEFAENPYAVNEPMGDVERLIPFTNMIYLEDGPSDIPCMSLVQHSGGFVIGILSKKNPAKTWALGYGRRANVTVPPEFGVGDYAYEQVRSALVGRADEIMRRMTGSRPTPGTRRRTCSTHKYGRRETALRSSRLT